MIDFTHLHVHTHYSILDGMSTVQGLVDKCLRVGMNALAITDHGTMFGIKEFYDYVDKKNGKVRDEIKRTEQRQRRSACFFIVNPSFLFWVIIQEEVNGSYQGSFPERRQRRSDS